MITLVFFGRLRELLDCQRLVLEELPNDGVMTVASLREFLAQRGGHWQEFLATQHALVAVNQTMAQEDKAIHAGDEVAFFPPVTGG